MAKGYKSGSGYSKSSCDTAHNYVVGMDNPMSGGPGDTPKRQSGRQSNIGRNPSEKDAGVPTPAFKYSDIGKG